jgi:hypothetical protein
MFAHFIFARSTGALLVFDKQVLFYNSALSFSHLPKVTEASCFGFLPMRYPTAIPE